jgi:hypothetical protein
MPLKRDSFPRNAVKDYETVVRNGLRNGDVVLCSGTGVFSTMIQAATDSVWSHAAFVLRLDEIDRVLLLESVEPIGVRCVRLSKYIENYANDGAPYPGGIVVVRHANFEGGVDNAALKKLTQYAIDQFGYPYDKDEIAKIAARILSAKIPFTPKQLNRIAQDEEFICSEYVARCYEEVGLKIEWNQLGFVSPADIAVDPNFELVAVLQNR